MAQITTRDGRYYLLGDEKFPSVTTVLSKGIPKPGLIRWAGNFVAQGAVRDFSHWGEMSDEEAIAYLSGLPDRRRNSSANLGSSIHAAVDAVANNREMKPVSPQAQEYVNGFMKFVTDWKPKFLLTEVAVFNRTHRYAGTLDIVARIGRTNYVIDTKTGSRIYPEVALQLSAYANAEFVGREGGAEEPLPVIKKGAVLHLSPNGYELVPARIDSEVFETFLSVKDIYHWDSALSKVVLHEPMEAV
jgi:hypothetical protein